MLLTHVEKQNTPLAMVFGVTGQDGSYLSELLLDKGYRVIGVKRRSSVDTTERLKEVNSKCRFELVEGDLTDPSSIMSLMTHFKPDECYNLAAQSHVKTSFEQPTTTFQINAVGVLNILEAIRVVSPETKFYQASTSEMFGSNYSTHYETIRKYSPQEVRKKCIGVNPIEDMTATKYQDENTPLYPNSPYAVAKVAAHNLVDIYRKAYGLHASCGILFNHESPRRGEEFVTRKITKWVAGFQAWKQCSPCGCRFDYEVGNMDTTAIEGRIFHGMDSYPKLRLGNLDARRDWGHARDYIEGMWAMLQQDEPDDYLLATGESHTIREFLDAAFKAIGIDDWDNFVVVDPKFYRPLEVDYLHGRPTKANKVLDWTPKTTFEQLVTEMVESDIDATQKK